ncbi:MAG: hypothetical protein V4490_06110 [Pseudomonadota bacterium]
MFKCILDYIRCRSCFAQAIEDGTPEERIRLLATSQPLLPTSVAQSSREQPEIQQPVRPNEDSVQVPEHVYKTRRMDRGEAKRSGKHASFFQIDDIQDQPRTFIIDYSRGDRGYIGAGRDGRVKFVRDTDRNAVYVVKIREIDNLTGKSISKKTKMDRDPPAAKKEAMALYRMGRLIAFGFRQKEHSKKYYLFQAFRAGAHLRTFNPALFSIKSPPDSTTAYIAVGNNLESLYFYSNFLYSAIAGCVTLAQKKLFITDFAICNFLIQNSGIVAYIDFADFYDDTPRSKTHSQISFKRHWNAVSSLSTHVIAYEYLRFLSEQILISLEELSKLYDNIRFFFNVLVLDDQTIFEMESCAAIVLAYLARVLVAIVDKWTPDQQKLNYKPIDAQTYAYWKQPSHVVIDRIQSLHPQRMVR